MLEYTPQVTSRELIQAGIVDTPATVVDFCAGSGSLLLAAKERWPNARYFANDIDQTVLGSIPGIDWISSDFLSSDFAVKNYFGFPERFDLILLNPPFSFKYTQSTQARSKYFQRLLQCCVCIFVHCTRLFKRPRRAFSGDADLNAKKRKR